MATRRSFSTAAAPTTLATGINNAVTSLTVQDGSTYVDGTSGPSVLTIDRGKSNEERILYTSRVGNTFTGLTRGYNGTAAQDHTAGAIVEHTSTQQDFDEANAHLADATLDQHTQYVRTDGTRPVTGNQTFNASVKALGTDHYFGPNALGGAGARLHVNSDVAQTSVLNAEASGANSNLIVTTKGTGGFAYNNGGVQQLNVSGTGTIQAIGNDHYFGANALGAAGTRIRLGGSGDPNNAYVMAEGSGSDVGLVFRPKGSSGTVRVQDTGGVDWWYVRALSATAASDSQAVIVFNSGGSPLARALTMGAVDSGGIGRRTVTIAN